LVAGVKQINPTVPTEITGGNIPIVVSIAGIASQSKVTVSVQ
jgi:uncharacterized protein (TIGR03437 family)